MKELITVEFHSDNTLAVSDSNIESWYQDWLATGTDVLKIACELQLLRLRIGVMDGELTPFNLLIVATNECVSITPKGKLDTWPQELCVSDKLLDRILGF